MDQHEWYYIGEEDEMDSWDMESESNWLGMTKWSGQRKRKRRCGWRRNTKED